MSINATPRTLTRWAYSAVMEEGAPSIIVRHPHSSGMSADDVDRARAAGIRRAVRTLGGKPSDYYGKPIYDSARGYSVAYVLIVPSSLIPWSDGTGMSAQEWNERAFI